MNGGRLKQVQPNARGGVSLAFILILLFSPLHWASQLIPLAPSGGAAQAFTFTPHVTPLALTVTLQPTIPVPVGAQASPIPVPGGPQPSEGTPEPAQRINGGDSTIGYEFIDTPGSPRWRIWIEDQVFIVDPTDPATGSLLDAFRNEADERVAAASAMDQARLDRKNSDKASLWGAVGLVGGGIAALASCLATPLTLVAGIGCVGGIVAAIGGLGVIGVSQTERSQAVTTLSQETVKYSGATAEAGRLFNALTRNQGP